MRTRIGAVIVASALTVSATPLLAHHTVSALYDIHRLFTLKGTVTEVEWRYPHVLFHLDAKYGDGRIVSWIVEARHPQGMRQNGVTEDSIKAGDVISADVYLAKDGTQKAATLSITLPGGTVYGVRTVTSGEIAAQPPGEPLH
jgi:uncharacterized protein DUF6152